MSIGLEKPQRSDRSEDYLQLPFVGLFSTLDKETFARWENDGAPGVLAGASDRENNGPVWVYEGLPHSSKDRCEKESCLEILGFLFTISPKAVVMQSYGTNAKHRWSLWKDGEDGAELIRSAGEACHRQAVNTCIMSWEVRVCCRTITFQTHSDEAAPSELELAEWMHRMLQGRGWVKNTAPWLWPVLRDSLKKGGLNAFLEQHRHRFDKSYDFKARLWYIRCHEQSYVSEPRNALPQLEDMRPEPRIGADSSADGAGESRRHEDDDGGWREHGWHALVGHEGREERCDWQEGGDWRDWREWHVSGGEVRDWPAGGGRPVAHAAEGHDAIRYWSQSGDLWDDANSEQYRWK